MTNDLFSEYQVGTIQLKNRIVMAPMTRSRAIDGTPNELMVQYYGQRANAGLIITEGTAPSANGSGYPRIPGLWRDDQVNGWQKVTAAVHDQGGLIFAQLMHVGRIAHPANMADDAEILAPSAITAAGEMFTDLQGARPHPEPREMTAEDIAAAVEEYTQAARNAIRAGFDGVELHGANGYLIDQFLNPGTNQRTDSYGGTVKNRARFAVEVARSVSDAIGASRVGIRLSPGGAFNDVAVYEGWEDAFTEIARLLGHLDLAYLHIVDHSSMGAPTVGDEIKARMRKAFDGTLILSGGYDQQSATAALAANQGDLIAFGRPYIANPDLLARFTSGAPLAAASPDTFYTPGDQGYTDYPTLDASQPPQDPV